MKSTRILVLMGTALTIVAVLWFYYWTAASNYPGARIFAGPQNDYYNLLVHGFRDGHLAMKATPDPALGVDNAKAKSFLLDASFYRGSYYLYFGVTPALVLFWPWALLTGHDLPEWLAAAFLASAVFLVGTAWLNLLRREFFPRIGVGFWVAAVFSLGLGSGLPVVLRRPMFYEVAILSGCAWTMAGLLCLTLATVRPGRALKWLTLAGTCAGLAAGSRPTLIPGSLVALLLMAVVHWWRDEGGAGRTPVRAIRSAGAALVPVGVSLAGLAWYNWARFDNPFEFGLRYQLGSHGNGFPFTLASLGRNLAVYYLTPPDTGWFFPFFAPGPKPIGSYFEQVHGQFLFLPLFLLLAGVGAWAAWRHRLSIQLAAVAMAAGVWAVASLTFVAMAPVHSNRYQLDFHPILVVLVLVAVLACTSIRRARWLGWVAAAWLAVIAGYNVFISFHVHGFFQDANRREYIAIARVCDRLVWPLHRLTRPALSGVELSVVFGEGTIGRLEPLLVAGGGPDLDAVLVKYTAPGRARLVFDHQDFGGAEGSEFDLCPGKPRRLEVRLGTLCPPEWHPWYDTQPPGSVRQRTRVAIRLDGIEVFARDMVCYQGSSNQIVLGRRRGWQYGEERFSGKVQLVGALEPDRAWLDAIRNARGLVRLRVMLPRNRFGAHEPLLMTGEPGKADLVGITYLRDGAIQLTMHHEGLPELKFSPPISVDYSQPHEFLIDLGSIPSLVSLPAKQEAVWQTRGVGVRLDGRTVMTERFNTHPAKAWEVYAGCTPWPFSWSRQQFGGQMLEVSRARVDVAQVAAALAAGRPLEFTLIFPKDSPNASEPLLTTGENGRGDGIYVHYTGDGAVSFGFDHWGVGGSVSKPAPVDFGAEHHLLLSYGALLLPGDPARGRLRLVLDGQILLDESVEFYPASPSQVAVGLNPIGLSTSQPAFMGSILAIVPAERGTF